MNKNLGLFLCLVMCAVPVLADQQSVQDLVKQGDMYRDGHGVVQDYAQAMTSYRKAADQGSAEAQNNIGSLYLLGRGVSRDPGQAITWFRRAADNGSTLAENNLGYIYQNGMGVPQDLAIARSWYQKAANQGNARAQSILAKLDASSSSSPAPAASRVAGQDTGRGAERVRGSAAAQIALSLVGVWVCHSQWEKAAGMIYTDQLTFNPDGSFSYNLNGAPPLNNTVWRQNGSSIEVDNLRIPGTQRGLISDSTHASWTMLLDGALVTYNCERAEAPATTADQRKPATEHANAANTTASYDASPVKAAPRNYRNSAVQAPGNAQPNPGACLSAKTAAGNPLCPEFNKRPNASLGPDCRGVQACTASCPCSIK